MHNLDTRAGRVAHWLASQSSTELQKAVTQFGKRSNFGGSLQNELDSRNQRR